MLMDDLCDTHRHIQHIYGDVRELLLFTVYVCALCICAEYTLRHKAISVSNFHQFSFLFF